jgi:hypothetical protein
MGDYEERPMNDRRWYADWRVWLCMVGLVLCAAVQWLVGLPFRLLESVWNLLF